MRRQTSVNANWDEGRATKKGDGVITAANARAFLTGVKKSLSDRGIPSDIGCQRLDEISEQPRVSMVASGQSSPAGQEQPPACESNVLDNASNQSGTVDRVYDNRNNNFRSNNNNNNNNGNHSNNNQHSKNNQRNRSRGRGRSNRSRGGNNQRTCYVCNRADHIAADCANQYCQRCGDWGHGMSRCNRNNQPVRSMIPVNGNGEVDNENIPEASVQIDIKLDGKKTDALLDSCASVSVIDLKTLQELRLKWKMVPWTEELKSFDNSVKKTVGYIHIKVGIGSQDDVTLKFKVMKCKDPIPTLLGRDFLFKHKSTEFNWETGRIRINQEWIHLTSGPEVVHILTE